MNALKIAAAIALVFLLALPSSARSTEYLLGEINPPGKESVPCMIKIYSEEGLGSPQFFELTYKSGESVRTDVFKGDKTADNSIAAQDALQRFVLTGVFGDETMEALITDTAGKVVFMISAGKGEAVLKDNESAASAEEKPASNGAAPIFMESVSPALEKPQAPVGNSLGKTAFVGKLYENDASSFPLKAEITAGEGGSCEILLSYKGSEEKFIGTLDKSAIKAGGASGSTLLCSLQGQVLNGVKLQADGYQSCRFQAEAVGADRETKTGEEEAAEKSAAKKLTRQTEKFFLGKFKEKGKESLKFVLRISVPEKGIREFLFTTFLEDGSQHDELLLGAMDENYFKAALPLDDGKVMIAKGHFKEGGVTGSLFLGSELLGSFSALDSKGGAQSLPIAPFWQGELKKGNDTLNLRLHCGRSVVDSLITPVIYIRYAHNSNMHLASFSGEIKDGTFSAKNNRVFTSEEESIEGTYTAEEMEGVITFSSGEKASFRCRKKDGPQ
ncbi:hypothetical protein IKZ40_06785 [bacterium]|nr:hypothetical protein [bacterium]